jgi:hypothetical protein
MSTTGFTHMAFSLTFPPPFFTSLLLGMFVFLQNSHTETPTPIRIVLESNQIMRKRPS